MESALEILSLLITFYFMVKEYFGSFAFMKRVPFIYQLPYIIINHVLIDGCWCHKTLLMKILSLSFKQVLKMCIKHVHSLSDMISQG